MHDSNCQVLRLFFLKSKQKLSQGKENHEQFKMPVNVDTNLQASEKFANLTVVCWLFISLLSECLVKTS